MQFGLSNTQYMPVRLLSQIIHQSRLQGILYTYKNIYYFDMHFTNAHVYEFTIPYQNSIFLISHLHGRLIYTNIC